MLVRPVLLLLSTVAAALVLAGPASALLSETVYTSVGTQHHRFVALGTRDGRPVLRVTAAAKRKYGRHWIEWRCTGVDADSAGGGGEPMTANADPIDVEPDDDYCLLQVKVPSVRTFHDRGRTFRVRGTRHLRQAIAITPAGEAHIRRVRGSIPMNFAVAVVSFAYDRKSRAFTDLAKFAAEVHFILLPTADAPAPRGKTGIWAEGSRFRVSHGLADGTQLFYDSDLGNRVLTTNVSAELAALNDSHSWWTDTSSYTSAGSS